ncbi:methyltransferase family protein [Chitinophaga dinghuensis]|uniref:Methyltransferase family protein n=1 Tax=Chitinophaga dinghuensis TaxID=1539050 RepID=A0A327VU47_9BACT|nr:class I SAM-dependent methyltransferase [Chitinophaga dinghuensis]RAJ77539.1 methyltransferase family protein [Chitinophaga dinghuensis]
MATDSMSFNHDNFNQFLHQSDEKTVIINSILKIIGQESWQSCLEIGVGTDPVFSRNLRHLFQEYTIVEKDTEKLQLPDNVTLITSAWEDVQLEKKFDVIIASHVFYYLQQKRNAIDKMLECLTPNGILIIVVNGQEEDYGPLKEFFYQNIQRDYHPTYPQIANALTGIPHITFTIPAAIHYEDYDTLYQSLSLFFDQYPVPYSLHKHSIINYLKQTLNGQPFKVYQKVIVCRRKFAPWRYLLDHPDYEIPVRDIRLSVWDGVFSPDEQLTRSTPFLLNFLPDMQEKSVLDIGCGSGILSILAGKQGAAKVVAADISAKAVSNTMMNITVHHLEDKITTVQSDLFDNISGKYDYIFGNLPILEDIWQGNNSPVVLLQRFLAEAKEYLLPDGQLYFSWASFAPIAPVLSMLQTLSYRYSMHAFPVNNTMWYVFIVELP